MTVQELIDALSKADPTSEVVIDVNVPNTTIGPSPSAKVLSAFNGFDWDNGTFRLQTDGDLVKLNKSQMDAFNNMKKEASTVRRKAWNSIDKELSFEDKMAISKSKEFEKDVHPLFKTNGD